MGDFLVPTSVKRDIVKTDYSGQFISFHIEDDALLFGNNGRGKEQKGIFVERWRAHHRRFLNVFFGVELRRVIIENEEIVTLPESQSFNALHAVAPAIADRQAYVCFGKATEKADTVGLHVEATVWASAEQANQLMFPAYLGYLMLDKQNEQ